MKYRLLIAVLALPSSLVFSQTIDTLTRSQVYDFDVQDTFDFYSIQRIEKYPYGNTFSYAYSRKIIINRYYSQNGDTLFIVEQIHSSSYPYNTIDTLVLANLQDYEIYLSSDSFCWQFYSIDTASIYDDRILNGVSNDCYAIGGEERFAEGLGHVYSYSYYNWSDGYDPYPQLEDTTKLIFFSKDSGSARWGTPIFTGAPLVHYTPLPEECAIWTANIYDYPHVPPYSSDTPFLVIQEQIRSGNRIPFHGHAYVEMIYRSYDLRTNQFTPDTLIGYYRNDTISKKALFYQSLSDTTYLEYNFDTVCPAPYSMDQVTVGGQLRSRWFDIREDVGSYIEGVGGAGGLIRVKKVEHILLPYYNYTINTGKYELACFSVCGETLYPNNASEDCPLVTAIQEMRLEKPISIEVYPALNNGNFSVRVMERYSEMKIIIYNAIGERLAVKTLQDGQNEIHLEGLRPGIYLWTINSALQQLQSGKIIIE